MSSKELSLLVSHSAAPVFDNSYARLPERFYARRSPTPVADPRLVRVNPELADELGLDPDWLQSPQALQVLAGNRLPDGADPIATAYAGHQFGGWNPQLGDGRAILLGEILSPAGERFDLQLKGAGRTPWSRGGDGRSPLGPVLREYLVSEAMARLGVPTTRSLAAVTTGEMVLREVPLPGAVLTRVARSHIRVGTFQYFAARQDWEAVRLLADHVIARHYHEVRGPELSGAEQPYVALLEQVVKRQADLIARWMALGFIHGVMNTDNMLVSGETVDYGPCAFMDAYHPETVFSSIDHGGRYAYVRQPAIAKWNLAWLAQSLLPVVENESGGLAAMQAAVNSFDDLYRHAYERLMHGKLGLGQPGEQGSELIRQLLGLMAAEGTDYTLTLRYLAEQILPLPDGISGWFEPSVALQEWMQVWRDRLPADEGLLQDRQVEALSLDPVCIPRNHLVEEVIRAAEDEGNYAPFDRLVRRLESPFAWSADDDHYAQPPRPEQRIARTFCGT